MTLGDIRDAPETIDVPDTEEARERWSIGGLKEATWAMRKLAAIEARRAEVRAAYQAEVDRLDVWLKGQEDHLDNEGGFFRAHLEVYALLERDRSPRNSKGEPTVKRVTTPYGTVETRVSGGGWTASEETLAWAKENRPDLVKVKEEFKVGDAKKLPEFAEADGGAVVVATGEPIPGLVVAPKKVTATVKLTDLGGA